ncbi:hypothetical protein ABV23_RS01095 [Escherichia coli]|nr:hypothetical protein [Escherichia coli]USL83810.1 hypothetical protein A4_143 [Escherichia phage A4]
MTHQEWLDELKFKHDHFGFGVRQGHYDILKDKNKFKSFVLDEDSNRWFIYELAVRGKKID